MDIFSYNNDSCNSEASFYAGTLHFHENYINLLCTNVIFIQCTSTTWKLMFEWQQNKKRKLSITISYMQFEDVLCMYDKKKTNKHKYINGKDMKK